MPKIIIQVALDVSDAEVEKLNGKRKRLGRATTTGQEEALNCIGNALGHNYIFSNISVKPLMQVLEPNQWQHGCGQILEDEDGVIAKCLQCTPDA